jgi:hypothetical protein
MRAVAHGGDQVVAAREAAVERRARDTGGRGDVGQGR